MSAAASRRSRAIGLAVYAAMAAIVLLPLSWAFFGAFKPQGEIFAFPPSLLPKSFSLEAFATILLQTRIPDYLLHSAFVTSAATVLVLALAAVAAYGFSRWEFRGKQAVMVLLLVCQLIPSVVLIVPYYLMMTKLHLIDTFLGLILILSATHTPFAVWIMKSQFDSIPTSLDEAGVIDGASRFRILWGIIIPVSLPGIGAAAAITFITVWAEFLVPLVISKSPDTTLVSAGIYSLFGQDSTTFYNRLFAATLLATAPVIAIYMIAQEQFISGLTGGAEK